MTSCSLVYRYRNPGRIFFFHLQGKIVIVYAASHQAKEFFKNSNRCSDAVKFILTAIRPWHSDSRRHISGLHVVTNDNSAFIPIVAPRIVSPRRRNRCCVCVYCVQRRWRLASRWRLLHTTCQRGASYGVHIANQPFNWLRRCGWMRVMDHRTQGHDLTPNILSAMETLGWGKPNSVYYWIFPSVRGNTNLMFVFPCVIDTII